MISFSVPQLMFIIWELIITAAYGWSLYNDLPMDRWNSFFSWLVVCIVPAVVVTWGGFFH